MRKFATRLFRRSDLPIRARRVTAVSFRCNFPSRCFGEWLTACASDDMQFAAMRDVQLEPVTIGRFDFLQVREASRAKRLDAPVTSRDKTVVRLFHCRTVLTRLERMRSRL
jgi:hypothetical protein